MSTQACNAASRKYTMEKTRPAVIVRALASSGHVPGWTSPHPPQARETGHFGDHVRSAWALPCAARTKAHAGHDIIYQPVPGSGEPLHYLGGHLPALFAITCLHFILSFFRSWVSKTQPNHWTQRMANTRLTI